MKNPFKKETNTTLIAAIVVAGVAAGAIAFFFLTEKGQDTRRSLQEKRSSQSPKTLQ